MIFFLEEKIRLKKNGEIILVEGEDGKQSLKTCEVAYGYVSKLFRTVFGYKANDRTHHV